MIIKNIYINQFGCLKNKAMNFKTGMNIICLPNESGKSTVAEFIRVMLYGVNSLRFNQRKKYMPFGSISMGGEMTVTHDGVDYIIRRTFGNRKSDDRTEVFNAVSGAPVKHLSIDNIGGAMCGLSGDAYENICYIKQLSSKINDVKSSEIQSRLINLSQSSDENYSYRNAVSILDNAIRDLSGTRGKINQVQSVLNDFAVKSAKKAKLKAEYEQVKSKLDELGKYEYTEKRSKLFILSWLPVAAFGVAAVFTRINPIVTALFILSLIIALILTFKSKNNTSQKIEHAKQVGFFESRLETLKEQYVAIDVSEYDFYKKKLQKYNETVDDLKIAKDVLSKAFEQLQMDYSPKLNSKACSIFKKVTEGKYVEFMVDEDYNITVRNDENMLVSSEYLSGGTFDQIYFSLRMALVELVGADMPVVLDDAFALYDDERLKEALKYLKTIDNQIIVFSCQSRERNIIERI